MGRGQKHLVQSLIKNGVVENKRLHTLWHMKVLPITYTGGCARRGRSIREAERCGRIDSLIWVCCDT